jgi:IS5 family transposase
MKHADAVLADEAIVATVYEALAKRHPKSRCRGRRGAPADMVLRLLVLKHIRNGATRCWSGRCGPIWCTGTSPM